MKKHFAFFIILILTFTFLTGCGLFGKKDEVFSDLKPYRITNTYDRSLGEAKRIELSVYLEEKTTNAETLRKYTNEIVKNYKEDYHGVMVCFYDILEETADPIYTPLAVGIWAPKGNFAEATVFHKYKDSNYSLVLKKNKKVYEPTEEELDMYIDYIRMKDKTVEEALEAMGVKEEEVVDMLETISKVQHRYEDNVER